MRSVAALILGLTCFGLLCLFAPARLHAQGDTVFFPIVISENQLHDPWPANWTLGISPNTWLTWAFDSDEAEIATFDIYLDDTPPYADTLIASGVKGTFVDLPTLNSGWRYYWRVVARRPNGSVIYYSPQWSFRTEVPDEPLNLETMVSIPAGELNMGCDESHNGGYPCRDRELPLHKVWVDAFEIDKYEVTNVQYAQCVAAGECNAPRFNHSLTREWYYGNPEFDEYPVLYVSWWNAGDYCDWKEKRLPTEAEWEMAARGPYDTRAWPWGNERIDCTRANFTDNEAGWLMCVGDTSRVGAYPAGATPLGVMDMAGNAFEWVHDVWDINYYKYSPAVNPQGPGSSTKPENGPSFVIRGGSYRPNWFYPRAFNRHWGHHGYEGVGADSPYYRNNQVGFRCAR